MSKRDYAKFEAMVELIPPKPAQAAGMERDVRNWALLHPRLAVLKANEAGLNVCRQFMHVELNREEGPRWHIMDRLYKRFSNLRREMETAALAPLMPEVLAVAEE